MRTFEKLKLKKKQYNKTEEIFFLKKKEKSLLIDSNKETILNRLHLVARSQHLRLLKGKTQLVYNKTKPFLNRKNKNGLSKTLVAVNGPVILANSLKKLSFGNTFEINKQVCFYPKNVLYDGSCFCMAKLYFLSETGTVISHTNEVLSFINIFISSNKFHIEAKTVLFAWIHLFRKYKLVNLVAKQNLRVFCRKILTKASLRIKHLKSIRMLGKLSFRKYLVQPLRPVLVKK